jgi:hypothetical protein
MISLRLILMVLLFCGFFSFVTSGAEDSLDIRTVAKGGFSGLIEPIQKVLKTKADWEKLWAEHAANIRGNSKMPEVDWAKEMVIVAAMGRQRTGGYAIEITRVCPTAHRLQIFVKKKTPPPGAIVTQALTAPFHMVAVPKNDLKAEFVELKEDKQKQQ